MARWIRFAIAILAGFGLGLLYGWVINPVEYVNTTPDTLRIDYQTDYVLMVAEAYQNEGDLNLASQRLSLLGDSSPVEIVYDAMLFAEKAGYSDADMAVYQEMLSALQAVTTDQETNTP